MCFSAKASFFAAGLLSIVGLLSYASAKNKKSLKPISYIPLIFAVQQACEGIVWLWGPETNFGYCAGYLFFIVAFAWWPLWIPLSLYRAEKQVAPALILRFYCIAGILWFLGATLSLLLFDFSVSSTDHIVYALAVPFDNIMGLIATYVTIVAGPFFVSTLPYARVFGISLLAAFGISYWYWVHAYGSVWCFFAAWLSSLILLMVRSAKEL